MIITKTPLRISLFGGGTDLESFYRHYGGACLSFAIDKYIYVTLNDKFDKKTRVSYSITETVDDPSELKHDIVRESLAFFNTRGVEITSVSDIPGTGTGLGSSSSFSVGLLAALSARTRNGVPYCRPMLAETAHTIESNLCGHPCGKQDHYAAAYGDLHYYGFNQDGTVQVQPVTLSKDGEQYLQDHLMLFWTGISRSSGEILEAQRSRLKNNNEAAVKAGIATRELADYMVEQFERGDFSDLGKMLHLAWKTKKLLNPSTTNPEIDLLYATAFKNGALGGKLCGAGGGGFFLFVVPPEKQETLREKLKLRQVPFKIEPNGSKVIYYG